MVRLTVLVVLALSYAAAQAAPQPGQIVVDPDAPGRMVYHSTYITVNGVERLKPCVFAGPGDPEDFFYNNTDANQNLLISKGARCTYVIAYLKDFGGGNPGSGSTLAATLDSWEQRITALENAGIITVFFFFDDSQGLPAGWESAVDAIVDTFEHHKLFVWSVAEEYSEALTKAQVSAVAARIRSADDRGHVVGVHQLSGTSFDFAADANLDMFLVQFNGATIDGIHAGMAAAWNSTGGNKIIDCAELADHAAQDRATARKWTWAAIMGGASAVQVFQMGRASDDAAWNESGKYDDCAELMDFMEHTDVNEMSPHDDLKAGASKWVLAKPGVSYIAYTDNLSGTMGVKDMNGGKYTLTWLDISSGDTAVDTQTVDAGQNGFAAPAGFGGEVAVWICGSEGATRVLTSAAKSLSSARMVAGGIVFDTGVGEVSVFDVKGSRVFRAVCPAHNASAAWLYRDPSRGNTARGIYIVRERRADGVSLVRTLAVAR